MRIFLANLLLAILWAASTRGGGLDSLAFGFALGYGVLWWLRPMLGPTAYFRKLPSLLRFAGFFLKELIQSNWRVAYDVITPHPVSRPGIVAVPLEPGAGEVELTILASFITLTPGSLTIDISDDQRVMYVHSMFAHEPEEVRRNVREFERRLKDIMGGG